MKKREIEKGCQKCIAQKEMLTIQTSLKNFFSHSLKINDFVKIICKKIHLLKKI